MSRRLALSDLLNPVTQSDDHTGNVDVQHQLDLLQQSIEGRSLSPVPDHVRDKLQDVLDYLQSRASIPQPSLPASQQDTVLHRSSSLQGRGLASRSPQSRPPRSAIEPSLPSISIRRDVKINKRTTLAELHSHPLGTNLEYPETGAQSDEAVGHLFELDPSAWERPGNAFAYSRGEPGGKYEQNVLCSVLVDSRTGKMVPCSSRHKTCQGAKICPFYDIDEASQPHSSATRTLLQERLLQDREERLQFSSPTRDVFQRTASYITALRRHGCSAPASDVTELSDYEKIQRTKLQEHHTRIQRGYLPLEGRCAGRLEFDYTFAGAAVVKCEHYNAKGNRDHFFDQSIGTGPYDVEYIEAVLTEDEDEINRIEAQAEALGYGPKVACRTVANFSAQRSFCPCDHRDSESGKLVQHELIHLSCGVKFREYEPLEEYRHGCPRILVVSKGPHHHPIPLPTKTPGPIKKEIITLLRKVDGDLPDLTPRGFLRHSILKSYLLDRCPGIIRPQISDVHVSLANRSHLRVYIDQVKQECFPKGTGWEGVIRLKQDQDSMLPPHQHYIRTILTLPMENLEADEDDEIDDTLEAAASADKFLRMIICMSVEGSKRLAAAQYVQSDIAFKRIVGFKEFEISAMDRDANTSITFCRVFLNRQTAKVHQRVFQEIDAIVKSDTGQNLRWRHLHATSLDDHENLLLHWAGDQHGGQAKGLGLYLEKLAQSLPQKQDLHETRRRIVDLGPYDHVHRIYRLCVAHFYRNVHESHAPKDVQHLMRSLVCITHNNWDQTVEQIRSSGKIGAAWVKDKERSKFAFAAICWEKSFIPINVWKAGDRTSNVSEIGHRNVNREGVRCTIVGGVKKGDHFDSQILNILETWETYGIRPTYGTGHISENSLKNLKRKVNTQHRHLMLEDQRIEAYNSNVVSATTKLNAAVSTITSCEKTLRETSKDNITKYKKAEAALQRAHRVKETALKALAKEVDAGKNLMDTGSGKVLLLLPSGEEL